MGTENIRVGICMPLLCIPHFYAIPGAYYAIHDSHAYHAMFAQ